MNTNSSTTDQAQDYDMVIEKVAGELPSIPVLIDNILKMAANTEAANFALCSYISKDQSVFSKILKIATPACQGSQTGYFGMPNSVT